MGLRDLFKGTPSISGQTMLSLTETGKSAVDKMVIGNKTSQAILFSLDEHSPQSISSIVKDSRLSYHEVKKKAIQLARQGYIHQISDARQGFAEQAPSMRVE